MLQGNVLYKGIERKHIVMKSRKQPVKTSSRSIKSLKSPKKEKETYIFHFAARIQLALWTSCVSLVRGKRIFSPTWLAWKWGNQVRLSCCLWCCSECSSERRHILLGLINEWSCCQVQLAARMNTFKTLPFCPLSIAHCCMKIMIIFIHYNFFRFREAPC